MRQAEINRKTNETDISLKLCLDGTGKSEIDTGCGFLNHMLELFARHGRFDLSVSCKGDTQVDYHHTVEDIGIVLGKDVKKDYLKGGLMKYSHPYRMAIIQFHAVHKKQKCRLNTLKKQ